MTKFAHYGESHSLKTLAGKHLRLERKASPALFFKKVKENAWQQQITQCSLRRSYAFPKNLVSSS